MCWDVQGIEIGAILFDYVGKEGFHVGRKVVLPVSIGEVPGELEVEWREKLYINWEISLEYK